MKSTKLRTLLLAILSLLLVLSIFSSCAKTETSDDAKPTATEKAAEDTKEETEEEETLTGDGPFVPFEETVQIHIGKVDAFQFYGENDDYKSAEDNIWIDNLSEKLNIEFVFDWITSDGDSNNVKWNTAIASDSLPDMGTVNQQLYESLLDAGKIADMTETFNQYASPKLVELFDASTEKDYMTRNGIIWGLPMIRTSPQRFHVLVIRQDWLDKVNMEVPKTIDELVNVATAFKDAQLGGENTYGLAVGGTPVDNYASLKGFFQGYGIPYGSWAKDDNGEIYYGSVDERMSQPLLKLQEMYANGLLRQDYTVADVRQSITAGEVGIMYQVAFGPVAAVDLYQIDTETDIIGAEIPTLDGSLPTYYDSAIPNDFVFVNSDFEYPEAAVKVVNQIVYNLNDMEYDWGYIRSACPIGGVMYEQPFSWCKYYQEIEYAYETGDTSKFTTANAGIYYQRLIDFEAGQQELGKYHPIYRTEVGTYAILNDALQSNRIVNTEYMGAATETMVEKNSFLEELLNVAINKVIMGEDISVWNDAVAEWYATGGQTITDEVNAWAKEQ